MTFGISAGAALAAGATVAGAAISSSGAKKAAGQQAAGTAAANALSEQQAARMRADLSNYRNTGSAANNKLAHALGLGDYQRARDALYYELKQKNPGLSENWEPLESDVMAYMEANPGNQGEGFGSLLESFKPSDLTTDPSYQWRLDQGLKGVQNSAAAKGGLFSGAAAKALNNYAGNAASQEYGAAYARDATDKNRIYQMLSGTAGAGQNAAVNTGSNAQSAAQTQGNNLTSLGNAQGASSIAQGNALSGAINNGVNYYNQSNALNKALNGGNGVQASFSNTSLGRSGFGSGLAYGNQDLGNYL